MTHHHLGSNHLFRVDKSSSLSDTFSSVRKCCVAQENVRLRCTGAASTMRPPGCWVTAWWWPTKTVNCHVMNPPSVMRRSDPPLKRLRRNSANPRLHHCRVQTRLLSLNLPPPGRVSACRRPSAGSLAHRLERNETKPITLLGRALWGRRRGLLRNCGNVRSEPGP